MSLKKDGYEVMDAKAECDDQYREKSRRNARIMGYGDFYNVSESGETPEGGFIPRNNVKERL